MQFWRLNSAQKINNTAKTLVPKARRFLTIGDFRSDWGLMAPTLHANQNKNFGNGAISMAAERKFWWWNENFGGGKKVLAAEQKVNGISNSKNAFKSTIIL